YGTADGVLRRPHPAGGLLPAARRRDGAPADPRRHQQPGHLRLSPGVGDGEPDVSCELQPQAHSAAHADAWPTRGAATRLENESDAAANATVHCRIARLSMRGRPSACALKRFAPLALHRELRWYRLTARPCGHRAPQSLDALWRTGSLCRLRAKPNMLPLVVDRLAPDGATRWLACTDRRKEP